MGRWAGGQRGGGAEGRWGSGQWAVGRRAARLEAALGLLGDHLDEEQRAARQHHTLPQLPATADGVPSEHEAAPAVAVGAEHEHLVWARGRR